MSSTTTDAATTSALRQHLGRLFVALAIVLGLAATTACGASSGSSASGEPLRVLASSVPHAEIIKHLQDTGALGETKVQLTEVSGDLDPNEVLESGDIDANFFQHVPYQDSWSADHKVDNLVAVGSVHVEPLGLYSKKVKLDAIPTGATVALSNNLTNYVRGLLLLQQAGLITLDLPTGGKINYAAVSEKDISENKHQLKFRQVAPPQLPNTLSDPAIDLSIINGNYAMEAGLNPAKDALVLETAKDNPYANVLTVKKELQDDPRVKALAKALTSPETAAWIKQQYQGAVIPVVQS